MIPLLADTPDLSVLQDDKSWKTIRENAGRYGVAALMAYAVRPHVSSAERAWCDKVLTDCWMRHERMLRHLEFVLSLFADEGIPVVSLKGPLLARRYYTPAFLRKPAMDLDVAVVGRDLARACSTLVKAGYIQDESISEAKAWSHHVIFSHPSRPRVELHFRLSHQALGIPIEHLIERAVSCPVPNGREALVLGAADQLLHLAVHLGRSRFGTLFNLYELRRVCGMEPPGVRAEAIERAVDYRFCGVLRMLDIAFRTHWGEPFLPPEVVVPKTWLNGRLNEKLYEAFERWSEPGVGLTLGTRLRGRWLEFQITDTPADAARSLKLLARRARFQIARGAWGKTKDLAYGPDYTR
ncbi:MAG TPA: nucleotidyltransferase family protein [Bryobacteraceae bacterium]|nr:nucleotidyltransferase family protein [Bryobacteraceae bacterium]